MKRLLALVLLLGTLACGRSHAINTTKASIVRITGIAIQQTMFGPSEGQEVCTGFVVRPQVVLTAQHCVGTNMLFDGLTGELIGQDTYFDLALYRVKDLYKDPLYLRETPAQFDESIVAIGYGFGWGDPLVVDLRVMLPNHHVQEDRAAGIILQELAVGGMSGGPMIDATGQVVGITQQSHMGTSYGVGTLVIRTFLLDMGV